MKTFSLSQRQIIKNWILIDATDLVVGRLAAYIANVLRGKHKPEYTPHMDCGDNIIVINAEKARFTGNKMKDKVYYRHTGYPGGIKSTTPEKLISSKFPDRIIKLAVQRMLSEGPMARKRLGNLYIYSGPDHKHAAQKPALVDFGSMNLKNKFNNKTN